MRAWLIFAALLAKAALSTWLAAQVEAAACAQICYTAELTGFGPGGTPGCSCSGSEAGARTGAGGCNCGQCYQKTQGTVYGFAINADGTCTYGTDCGDCDYTSGSSTSSTTTTPKPSTATPSPSPVTSTASPVTATPSPTPTSVTATPSPASAASAPSSTLAADTSSSPHSTSSSPSGSSNVPTSAPTDRSSDSHSHSKDPASDTTSSKADSSAFVGGLSTWQIALAISCLALIFVVAVVSVCACYCKARSRLYEHAADHGVSSYYNQNTPPFQPWLVNNVRTAVPTARKSTAAIV